MAACFDAIPIPFLRFRTQKQEEMPIQPEPSDKPLENLHSGSNNLPGLTNEQAAQGLVALVDHSQKHTDVSQGIHASSHTLFSIPWIHSLIPGIEKLAAQYHIGNFVAIRGSKEQIFEAMPIYARIGMHLLFYGREQITILHSQTVENLLKEQSIKEGRLYDSPESTASIPSFIATYSLETSELLEPDITKYKTFNEFFSRKLREDARPVENAADPHAFCSAADCRLTVYPTVDLAKEFWVKGREFNIPNLLGVPPASEKASLFDGSSLAIFRLAPSDYHRFHCPIDGTVGDIVHIPGQYYTVNPQAVNEPGFDVFTANTRSVLYLTHAATGLPVAFVAIGALLVGSIVWTNGGEKGKSVQKGDELGYFAYGGSTIIALFPKGLIEFDGDLVANSAVPVETMVKVGNSLGKMPVMA
ncbi:phosphatidylserine decarboxylase-domain-containing protein [Mycena belliarum]|uniref:phosphatidylserine decarboxylase n=1 Tax=Mycena belliarum TaxID=1033014 RepID=A0AAD6XNF6_9AGAR|nr:phosphatidylserine decarboxylase-domain-containing protein [Mycena belliae]